MQFSHVAEGRVLPPMPVDVAAASRGVHVHADPQRSALFYFGRNEAASQVVGLSSAADAILSFSFSHQQTCSREAILWFEMTAGGPALHLTSGPEDTVVATIGKPWAVDATGRELPTWYETSGATLIQKVDATGAEAPIAFDPTYYVLNCRSHHADTFGYWYLDITAADPGYCPPLGMFYAANGYYPVWGYDPDIANNYGKVIVKPNGDVCSVFPNSGYGFDFNVACRAHDYCYDLRKAGFSGTVSDRECDDLFDNLMEAHCNDRSWLEGFFCGLTRSSYYLGVQAGWVYTDPAPGIVRLIALHSGKCADVEGPSYSNNAPIQQWTCLGVANQNFRIWPAPNAPGLFQLKSEFSGKCADAYGGLVVQLVCMPMDWPEQSFKIQRRLNLDRFTLRSRYASFQRCWDVPGYSFQDGPNLTEYPCHEDNNQVWAISNVSAGP